MPVKVGVKVIVRGEVVEIVIPILVSVPVASTKLPSLGVSPAIVVEPDPPPPEPQEDQALTPGFPPLVVKQFPF